MSSWRTWNGWGARLSFVPSAHNSRVDKSSSNSPKRTRWEGRVGVAISPLLMGGILACAPLNDGVIVAANQPEQSVYNLSPNGYQNLPSPLLCGAGICRKVRCTRQKHPALTRTHSERRTVMYSGRSVGIAPQAIAGLSFLLLVMGTAHATFPGRNGLIAFQAQTDAGIQIFTVRSNGRGLQQITHLSGDAVAPDWSPDGRQIVFEHDAPGECANVAIMNADGAGLIEFPDQTLCQFDPSFTPDGTRIVFDRYDPATIDEAFWSMDRNGNDRQRIGPCCADPNVSPDGEKLSFLGFNGDPD